jgi:hypothetical protein
VVLPTAPSACFLPRTSSSSSSAAWSRDAEARPEHFAVTQGGNLVLSCAYFDGSVRAVGVDATKAETGVVGHFAPVTCMSISHDGALLGVALPRLTRPRQAGSW